MLGMTCIARLACTLGTHVCLMGLIVNKSQTHVLQHRSRQSQSHWNDVRVH